MQDAQFVHQAFTDIADRYIVTNTVLSMGIDGLWRKKTAKLVAAAQPKTVLDLATGSGDLALAIEKACPAAIVTGADFCEPMLAHARRRGLKNTVVADAMALPFADGSYDAVTVAFGLRNRASWPGALLEMRRVLAPGGHLFVLDFSRPHNGLIRPVYRFYLHSILPKIAGLLTGRRAAYEYLAGSIEAFPSGEKMVELLRECSFGEVKALPMTAGVVTLYQGTVDVNNKDTERL